MGRWVVRITKTTGKKLIFVKKMCKSGWASGIESVVGTEGHARSVPDLMREKHWSEMAGGTILIRLRRVARASFFAPAHQKLRAIAQERHRRAGWQ